MNIPALLSEFNPEYKVCTVRGSSRFVSGHFSLFAVLRRQILIKSDSESFTLYAGQIMAVPPGLSLSMFTQRRTELLLLSLDREAAFRDDALRHFMDRRVHPLTADSSLFMHMAECGKELSVLQIQANEGRAFDPKAISQRWALLFLQDLHSLVDRETEAAFNRKFSHLSTKNASLLKEILSLLRQDSGTIPGLSEAAQNIGVTPQYLAAFFKEHMSVTYMQYRKDQTARMKALETEYRSAGNTDEFFDAEIISSPSSAYSILSAASVTAQTNYGLQGVVQSAPLPKVPDRSSQAHEEPSRKAVSRKVIPAGTSPAHTLPSCFHKLINLGFASQFSDKRFWSQIQMTQEEIGFEYGRVCGILDLISEYRIHGSVQADYSRIFRVLDGLLSLNLIPFLELSGRGFLLQLGTSESISLTQTDNTASYNRFLCETLPSFLAACINRYGQRNVMKWKFEMIYSFTDFDKGYSLLSYAESFRTVRDIIHARLPGCEVCGPGFNDWSSPKRAREVFETLSGANALPDSFSALLYPVYGRPGEYRVSGDLSLLSERLSALCRATELFLPGSRIWITEYNTNLSARSLLNDSVRQSACLAALYARTIRLPLHGLGYYMLSDIPLRYIDTDSFFFGGWGLISDSDIPKPSYYAMKCLRRLGREILFRDHDCILTREGRSIRCLLFRETAIPEHLLNRRTPLTENSPDAAYFICDKNPEEPPADIALRFTGFSKGSYQITAWILAESSGNLLRAFCGAGFCKPATEDAKEALMLSGKPIPILKSGEVSEDGNLDLTLPGTECGIALILISPVTERSGGDI